MGRRVKTIYMRGKAHSANHSFTDEKAIGLLIQEDDYYAEWNVRFLDTPEAHGEIRPATNGVGYAGYLVGGLPHGYTWVAMNDRQ